MIIAGKMFRWPQNQRPVLTGTGQKLVVGTQANIQHTISMTFQTCQQPMGGKEEDFLKSSGHNISVLSVMYILKF